MPLTLATANLLHGLRLREGVVRTEDLAESARLLDADVLGLQEVDFGQPRSGEVDQVRAFAETGGAAAWRFVPTLLGDRDSADPPRPAQGDGDGGPAYGIGLISRLPVQAWHVWRFPAAKVGLPLLVPVDGKPRLSVVADEPRAAVAAVIEGPSGPFTVATAHLSFVPGVNARQLRRLVRHLADLPRPIFFLGDLNLPGAVPALLTGWRQPLRTPTYPAWAPRVQFDHLLVRGLSAVHVVDGESVELPISDHRALRARFPAFPGDAA